MLGTILMTGVGIEAGLGTLATLIGWLRGEQGDRKTREEILKALGDAQKCREGFAYIRDQDDKVLSEMILAQHEEILECLNELDVKTHQRFDNMLAEIRAENADLVAQMEERANHALRLSFNDMLRLPAPIEQGNKQHPSYLLNTRNEVVDFYGRTEELEDLHAWADHDQPLAIRLYTAPGGMGKTRLLRQFCQELNATGWITGFLTRDIEDFARKDARLLLAAPLKTLIVVDYPQEQTGAVEKLLKDLGRLLDENRLHHIRVVLLVRETGDWWDYMLRKGSLRELLEPARSIVAPPQALNALEPCVAVGKRQEVYLQALRRFTDILNTSVPDQIDVDLAANEYDRVLIIHMAAYAAACGHTPSNEQDLLDFVVDREHTRIQEVIEDRRLDPITHNLIAHQVMALVTLVGGVTKAQAAELLGRLILTKDRSAAERQAFLEMLHWLYPGTEDHGLYISAIEPDLLGEHFIAKLDNTAHEEALHVALDNGEESFIIKTLTHANRIARKSSDHPDMLEKQLRTRFATLAGLALETAKAEPYPMADLLTTLAKEGTAPEVLAPLEPQLPEYTTALREFAVLVTEAALQQTPTKNLEERARLLNNLGLRLSAVGRREEALEAAQETETLYRELSEKNPDAFLPDLAMSLNNLGNQLSYVGRREEALEAAKEAVDIRRKLSEKNPDAFLPDLAMSLNNLGNQLSYVGRREEALEAAKEAVDIRRKLSEKNPDAFLPDLAMSLNNMGTCLSDVGRREEALEAAKEAVDIYRKLAEKSPDAFLPDLASALNNLGNQLSYVGRREEALEAAKEAVDIRRELSEKNPDAFLPDLAMSLNNLGNRLSYVGRREEALEAAQEAVDIYRKLAEKSPDAFLPDLATSLGAMGHIYQNTGDVEQACSCFEEGIAHLLPLFEKHPDAFSALMGALVRDATKTAQTESAKLSDTTARAMKLHAAFVEANSPQ